MLLGMVFIGSALVVVLGMGLVDSLESESESEITYAAIETTEHNLATVSSTGQTQAIPWDKATYRPDGEVHIAWYNESNESSAGELDVAIEPLGAIEYDLEDHVVIQQGGASWERRNGAFYERTAPDIRYDGDFLRLRLLSLSEDDISDESAVARPDYDSDLPERLQTSRKEAEKKGYNDLALVIKSEYHDGWYDYLEGFDEYENVSVYPNNQSPRIGPGSDTTVQVIMENVSETDAADFWIRTDHGIVSGQHADENTFVEDSPDPFRLQATIENTGDERQRQDVNLTITDKDGTEILDVGNRTELDGGQAETVSFTIDGHASYFEPGTEYEYDVSTEDDNLNEERGTFYYAEHSEPTLIVSGPTVNGTDATDSDNPVDPSDDDVALEADVRNAGVESVEDEPVEFVLEHDSEDWEGTDSDLIERDGGETAPASWTINQTSLLEGEHTFTISTPDSEVSGHFYVSEGLDVGSSEIHLGSETDVNVTIVGSEISNSNPFDCEECRTAHVSERTEGSFVEGERVGYEWDTRHDWNGDATAPEWDESGGWNTDGEPECVDSTWAGCNEYGFPDSTEFWWDDSGGWRLEWTDDGGSTHSTDWDWTGPIEAGEAPSDEPEFDVDGYEINWVGASAEIVTQPVDEDGNALDEPTPLEGVPWHETNLNRFDEPRPLYEYNFTTEERVSLMLSATSYNHGGSDYCGGHTDTTYTDTYNGGVWDHTECSDDAVGGGNELVSLSADTETEETNVRVLGQDDTQLPELNPGVERQMSTDDLLERPEVDVPVDEDGYLDLGEHEFIFVFEITHHPREYNTDPSVDPDISADDYWETAHDESGDPNFNDMIAHVEITPAGQGSPEIDPEFSTGQGSGADGGTGSADEPSNSGGSNESDIDVDTDEIIIG
nr:flagellin [Natrarchaeobius halalkaliphilus]